MLLTGIIVAILVIIVFAFIGIYNSLVIKKKRVENAWSQIEVQLKRRHDLIPNLVNAVKGYMKFEKETLEAVINARAKAVSGKNIDERIKAEGELSGALGRLLAVFERYPELKSNQQVSQLMEELTSTENRITYARQFYNDTVMKYNTSLEVFPSNIIARSFGFKPFPFFEAQAAEKETPKVDLTF
ncbi:LemA family protein [Pseudothermotoga thermarum]|uniref:LemA family protein n=1 Tax=Pseudothermotoga thermarum DSM 5069 TaxID=688269 RepID=F7YWD4_9THEM|nr:LemA family protein [Pseudothermotoga thermarum]AEH51912.1 LemA family protein [Pseudothermotoga thermarum DSM 5069]